MMKNQQPAKKAKTTKARLPSKRAPAAKKPIGRPSTYTQEIADRICERIAEGEALYRICKEESMPGLTAVYSWLRVNADFAKNYARAKEDAGETMASRTQAVLDEDPVLDPVTGKIDSAWVQLQRLKVDTLKWHAGKLKPKVYGDKVDVNHGVQPENPLASLLTQINGTALPVVKGDK